MLPLDRICCLRHFQLPFAHEPPSPFTKPQQRPADEAFGARATPQRSRTRFLSGHIVPGTCGIIIWGDAQTTKVASGKTLPFVTLSTTWQFSPLQQRKVYSPVVLVRQAWSEIRAGNCVQVEGSNVRRVFRTKTPCGPQIRGGCWCWDLRQPYIEAPSRGRKWQRRHRRRQHQASRGKGRRQVSLEHSCPPFEYIRRGDRTFTGRHERPDPAQPTSRAAGPAAGGSGEFRDQFDANANRQGSSLSYT